MSRCGQDHVVTLFLPHDKELQLQNRDVKIYRQFNRDFRQKTLEKMVEFVYNTVEAEKKLRPTPKLHMEV